jgi:hypothetical protein
MELIIAHKVEILALLLSLSEVLALIPSLKSNSIFQLIVGFVKKASGK